MRWRREHLPNAISLNTIMFQIASVTGPALGGLVIAFADVAWAYALNATSYGAVVVALMMMSPDRARVAGASLQDADRGSARRTPIRVPRAADPFHDGTGFLCDLFLVGDDRQEGRTGKL